MKRLKKILLTVLCGVVGGAGLFAGGGKDNAAAGSAAKEPPKEVKFAIGNWQTFCYDPTYVDPTTGVSPLPEDQRRVAAAAVKDVEELLNVTIKWVEYPDYYDVDILPSILAGKPIADLALIQTFTADAGVVYQDVMQDLTPYEDIFKDAESSWMVLPATYGKKLFITSDFNTADALAFGQVMGSPLGFNINYVEAVDTLKENGKTIYPTDLYKQGKWTWTTFEDYLSKLGTFYKNRSTPDDPNRTIVPYMTDIRRAAENALHSVGQAVFNSNGIGFNTPDGIRAIEFLENLYDKKLASTFRENETRPYPDAEVTNTFRMAIGETVFTDIYMMWAGVIGQELNNRGGMSMGIVPWPRPDDYSATDPRYQQTAENSGAWILLKGVSADQSRLALQALRVYALAWLREEGQVTNVLDYRTAMAETNAIKFTFDTFHPVIGRDVLEVFTNYSPWTANELGRTLQIAPYFWEIVGNSIFGLQGAPRYSVNVQQKAPEVEARLAEFKRVHGLN